MKLTFKLFFLLGICVILHSSCTLKSIAKQVTTSNDNGNALLLTKKTYPVSSIQAVNVSTSGGSISVMGDANQEASVEMYVNSNKGKKLSKKEIQEIIVEEYDIEIEQRNGVLHAHAKKKSNLSWNNALSISFKIHTGKQTTTEVSTSGGSIQLANLTGKQNFKTSGGSLKIENLKGEINGKTSGGSIKAYNTQGTINLRTSGGSITLENLDGNILASTSGGSITGNQIKGTLNAKTSGGSINLNDLSCKINASTSGGSVTVGINKIAGDVQLSTSAGSVNLTLPSNISADLNLKGSRVNTNGLVNFSGSNKKGKLLGSINGGGTSIYASTSAGNVNLKFQ